jgi:hypothetical protein
VDYDKNDDTNDRPQSRRPVYVVELIGGPDRDRTDDLFHAILVNMLGINDILRHLGDQKGTYGALRSRKSAPVCALFFDNLPPGRRREEVPGKR